jgi:hypothetical protein
MKPIHKKEEDASLKNKGKTVFKKDDDLVYLIQGNKPK